MADGDVDAATLAAETNRLLDFGTNYAHPRGGAAWLDSAGRQDPDQPVYTWITARMVHVYCLGHLLGREGDRGLAEAGLVALTGRLRDPEYGGWFSSVDNAGATPDEKACYTHAFVVLAASSGVAAGLSNAPALLSEALRVWDGRFFEPSSGMFVDQWNRTFTHLSDYRGANANMHAVEALLAAADAQQDPALRQKALGIAERLIHQQAREHDWRIPEHFTTAWEPLLEHNRDLPDDPFQPYGATVGHGLEWSRLLLHLEAGLGPQAPDWLAPAAAALFDRAVTDGWAPDGSEGFVYTTDWSGQPVVRDRMHWVLAEAIAAAAALHTRTGEERYAEQVREWWAYGQRHVFDLERGSWRHQLDPQQQVIGTVWPGKPDLYHAVQATLVPRLPLAPSIAFALAEGRLRDG